MKKLFILLVSFFVILGCEKDSQHESIPEKAQVQTQSSSSPTWDDLLGMIQENYVVITLDASTATHPDWLMYAEARLILPDCEDDPSIEAYVYTHSQDLEDMLSIGGGSNYFDGYTNDNPGTCQAIECHQGTPNNCYVVNKETSTIIVYCQEVN